MRSREQKLDYIKGCRIPVYKQHSEPPQSLILFSETYRPSELTPSETASNRDLSSQQNWNKIKLRRKVEERGGELCADCDKVERAAGLPQMISGTIARVEVRWKCKEAYSSEAFK